MYWPNLKSVAFPVPEIIGGTPKNAQSLDTPTLPFLQNCSWAFDRMDPVIVVAKFEVLKFVALPVPEIIAIGVLVGVGTPILGKGRCKDVYIFTQL